MDDENKEWFAVIADKDVFDDRGKLEYPKGSVVSYGTEVATQEVLDRRGLRKVSLKMAPDLSKHKWNPKTEQLDLLPVEEIHAS